MPPQQSGSALQPEQARSPHPLPLPLASSLEEGLGNSVTFPSGQWRLDGWEPPPHTGTRAVQKLSETVALCTPQTRCAGSGPPAPSAFRAHCRRHTCSVTAPRLCRHLGLLTSPSPMGSGGAEVQRKPGPAWGLVTRVDGSKSQSFCGVRAGPWCPLSQTRTRVQGRWQTVLELGICPPPGPLLHTPGTWAHVATWPWLGTSALHG